MSYAVARIDEVESLRTRHAYDWHSIRHHFGVRAFGVNANVAVEPGVVVEEHDEMHTDGGQEESTSSSQATRPSPSPARRWTRRPARSSSCGTRP